MALVTATLQASLTALLTADNADPATVATGLANNYVAYAQSGQFLLGTLGPMTALAAPLAQTLLAGMQAQTLAAFANAWSTGLTTLWIGVPIIGGLVGATINCPGAATVATSMLATFATPAASRADGVLRLVTELDTATRTVLGAGSTITVPPVVIPSTPIV